MTPNFLTRPEEIWNTFLQRWAMFKRGTGLVGAEAVQHLFHCCEDDLGDALLKAHPDAVAGNENDLMANIKKMAVIPVAVCVRRAELLGTQQDHGENARAFCAKLKGKATTCSYVADCTGTGCAQVIHFTDIIDQGILIAPPFDQHIEDEIEGTRTLCNELVETGSSVHVFDRGVKNQPDRSTLTVAVEDSMVSHIVDRFTGSLVSFYLLMCGLPQHTSVDVIHEVLVILLLKALPCQLLGKKARKNVR